MTYTDEVLSYNEETYMPRTKVEFEGHSGERLAGLLLVDDPDRRLFRMQNGGILALERDDDAWLIRWAVMPTLD